MCENLWKRIVSGIRGHILDISDLLANPNTAPYSRIKYLPRFGSDDQIADFLKGLFEKAVEGKYSGDWDSLSDYKPPPPRNVAANELSTCKKLIR